jgi:hypothetical protein
MVTSGTGHDRCPSQVAGPSRHPNRLMATPKKFVNTEKVSRGPRKFFPTRNGGWLTHSCADPLSLARPPHGRLHRFASPSQFVSSTRTFFSSASIERGVATRFACSSSAFPMPPASCRRPAACARVSSVWPPRPSDSRDAAAPLRTPEPLPLRRLVRLGSKLLRLADGLWADFFRPSWPRPFASSACSPKGPSDPTGSISERRASASTPSAEPDAHHA